MFGSVVYGSVKSVISISSSPRTQRLSSGGNFLHFATAICILFITLSGNGSICSTLPSLIHRKTFDFNSARASSHTIILFSFSGEYSLGSISTIVFLFPGLLSKNYTPQRLNRRRNVSSLFLIRPLIRIKSS